MATSSRATLKNCEMHAKGQKKYTLPPEEDWDEFILQEAIDLAESGKLTEVAKMIKRTGVDLGLRLNGEPVSPDELQHRFYAAVRSREHVGGRLNRRFWRGNPRRITKEVTEALEADWGKAFETGRPAAQIFARAGLTVTVDPEANLIGLLGIEHSSGKDLIPWLPNFPPKKVRRSEVKRVANEATRERPLSTLDSDSVARLRSALHQGARHQLRELVLGNGWEALVSTIDAVHLDCTQAPVAEADVRPTDRSSASRDGAPTVSDDTKRADNVPNVFETLDQIVTVRRGSKEDRRISEAHQKMYAAPFFDAGHVFPRAGPKLAAINKTLSALLKSGLLSREAIVEELVNIAITMLQTGRDQPFFEALLPDTFGADLSAEVVAEVGSRDEREGAREQGAKRHLAAFHILGQNIGFRKSGVIPAIRPGVVLGKFRTLSDLHDEGLVSDDELVTAGRSLFESLGPAIPSAAIGEALERTEKDFGDLEPLIAQADKARFNYLLTQVRQGSAEQPAHRTLRELATEPAKRDQVRAAYHSAALRQMRRGASPGEALASIPSVFQRESSEAELHRVRLAGILDQLEASTPATLALDAPDQLAADLVFWGDTVLRQRASDVARGVLLRLDAFTRTLTDLKMNPQLNEGQERARSWAAQAAPDAPTVR